MLDPLMDVTAYSMSALQRRSEAIADNVANANTPGFHAKRVEFEEKLGAALTDGSKVDTPSEGASVLNDLSLPDSSDNTVRLEGQMTDLAKTAVMRQMMLAGFNYKVNQLKTAIAGIR